MSAAPQAVSDMLVTVKSREVQRAMLAEMAGDRSTASLHFLAAAHLELVLARDYADAGQLPLAHRSRISAASCLWRGGEVGRARELLGATARECPDLAAGVQSEISDLEKSHPPANGEKRE